MRVRSSAGYRDTENSRLPLGESASRDSQRRGRRAPLSRIPRARARARARNESPAPPSTHPDRSRDRHRVLSISFFRTVTELVFNKLVFLFVRTATYRWASLVDGRTGEYLSGIFHLHFFPRRAAFCTNIDATLLYQCSVPMDGTTFCDVSIGDIAIFLPLQIAQRRKINYAREIPAVGFEVDRSFFPSVRWETG